MRQSLPVNIDPVRINSGRDMNVIYPRVFGMWHQQMEQFINQSIAHETQQLINMQVNEMSSPIIEMDGSFEIKNNQRNVLSLSLSNYAFHYQAANGITYIQSLTFDLKNHRRCSLGDLFKPGSNYSERLTELVNKQIKQRDIQTFDDHVRVQPDQDFYVADKTLVIYFQVYQITAGVYGFPMFPISVYDIADIINDDGPLGRMAEND